MVKVANIGSKVGTVVCESLGIDPNQVKKMKITFVAGGVAELEIEGYFDDNDKTAEVIKIYDFVER